MKEAKILWKKLRDGHRQALNKRKITVGQAAGDIRLWKYEKQMSFLLPHLTNRQRNAIAIAVQDSKIGIDETIENTQAEDSELGTMEEQQTTCNTSRNKRKSDNIIEYLERKQKERDQKSTARDLFRQELLSMKPKEDTALKKFFDSMHDQTSTLPEYLQIKVQRQIFNSVMEAREENVKQHNTQADCRQYELYSFELSNSGVANTIPSSTLLQTDASSSNE